MLKIVYYIIISISLCSFSTAAKKSVTELGTVEIDDLFFNPESPLSPSETAKAKFNHVDEILVENQDLELESLEIADIDLITFGEYENFLNKYYDDNFIEINSKFTRQLEFNFSSSIGTRIPFGANAKRAFNSGTDFGLTLSPIVTFKILNFDSKLYGNINYTLLYPRKSASDTYAPFELETYKIIRITGGITSYLNNNIFTKAGLSIISTSAGISSEYIEGGKQIKDYGASINIDLGYKFNMIKKINMGFYFRAQTMLFGVSDPPIDGGGTLETLSIGLIFESPVYLVY